MKRAWPCAVAVAALLSGAAPARAAMLVVDPLVEANTLQSTIAEVTAAAKRLEMINNQLIQIQHLISTVNAVAHGNIAALAQLSPELGALGLTSPLGADTMQLVQALTGLAGDVGVTGQLAQQILSTDQFYAPTGADFRAAAMNQMALVLARQKAMAQTALDSNTQRLTYLTTLRHQLGSTADIKAAADAGARLQGESATSQAQTNQLLSAQMLERAQAATTQAREEQVARCSMDAFVADAHAAAAAAYAGTVTMISAKSAAAAKCATVTAASAVATSSLAGGSASATAISDTGALGTMLAQPWGQQAADNATALGVNPNSLAATCVLESGCSANVGGTGTISGAFQMSNGTYAETVAAVQASNPTLAAQISGNKNDPASQSIAAAQYLLQGAQALQRNDIPNPTTLDVRGYYQFGPGNAAAIAQASDNQLMAPLMTGLSSQALAGNAITSSTTVGQWRASISNKIGDAASQPVLIGATRI